MCKHFQVQSSEEPLIEFEDTIPPPTIEIYQANGTVHYALPVVRFYQIEDSGMMSLAEMASAKFEDATLNEIQEIKKNPFVPEYKEPDYIIEDFFTDDSDVFQDCYQELAPTQEEQEQRLADLNIKLCDHCLIPCHFQYCDKCDLMFNPLSKILHLIDKLPESEEEVKLIVEDMSFQKPNEAIETEQYLAYPDLSKELELK
ncbi:hypothetical protein G9A89_011115 [Geosiphon pyriformis]|nr:hypothetical protein G9A89_011115 [Geosiphon pyriformis]